MRKVWEDNCCRALMLAFIVTSVGQSLSVENSSLYSDVNLSAKLDTIITLLQELKVQHQQQNTTVHDVTSQEARVETVESHVSSTPHDCADIRPQSNISGVYTIYVGVMQRPLAVYCDMANDGGGWTVFQRRMDGSTDFYRTWNDYKDGFGSLSREFWLGNENIHWLTSNGRRYKLRLDLADFDGNSRYEEYDNFQVGSVCSNYRLTSVGSYCGTAGNSLTQHVGYMFSTRDRDNDDYNQSCAGEFKGAWWYRNCHHSNLNGYYYGGSHSTYADGVNWNAWRGFYYSLRFTEMKIRPADV